MSLEPQPVSKTPAELAAEAAEAAEARIERLLPVPYSPALRDQYPAPVPLFTRRYTDETKLDEEGNPTEGDTPVLLRGVVAMLAAEGGAGKSMASLALAVHVALSDFPGHRPELWNRWKLRPWNERGEPVRPCAVLVLGEDSMNETMDRLECLLRALCEYSDERLEAAREHLAGGEHGPARLHVAALNGATNERILDHLRDYARELNPDLIILDPAVRFMGESDAETDNAQGAAFIAKLEDLWKRSDDDKHHRTTVLVTHHTNKASRDGRGNVSTAAARGASSLTDNSRAVFTLAPNPNAAGFVTLRHTKHNGTARAPQIPLTTHRRAMRAVDELPDEVREALMRQSARARAKAAAATAMDDARALATLWREVEAGAMPQSLAVMLTTADGRGTPKYGGELAKRKGRAPGTYKDACAMMDETADKSIVEALRAWAQAVAKDDRDKGKPPAAAATTKAGAPPVPEGLGDA
jgi:hypothetical protein